MEEKNIFGGFFQDQNFALTGILFKIYIVRYPNTKYSGTHAHTSNQQIHDLKLLQQVEEKCALLGY
jgi:hypothetical protein